MKYKHIEKEEEEEDRKNNTENKLCACVFFIRSSFQNRQKQNVNKYIYLKNFVQIKLKSTSKKTNS